MQPILSVVVMGMAILLPGPKDDQFSSMWNMIQPGTSLLMQVTAADGYTILSVNEEKCKLIKFADDTGKDMSPSEEKSQFSGPSWLKTSMFGNNSSTMMFVIQTDRYAAPAAKTVNVEAEISVKLAKGEKMLSAEKVSLTPKTKFEINGVKFTIKEVKNTKDWEGNECVEMTLQYKKKLDALKKVVFKDEAGKEIESSEAGSSSFTFNGNFQGDKTFRFKSAGEIKVANIEMVFYDDMKDETVSVKQTVGLCLPGK